MQHLLSLTGAPTGGTFTLKVKMGRDGVVYETAPLSFNAQPSDVRVALEALPIIPDGQVLTGNPFGPLPAAVGVTFEGQFQSVPQVSPGANNLTGGTSPAVSFVENPTTRYDGLVGRNDTGEVKSTGAGAWG